MFVRVKKSGKYQYLQIVHAQRINGRVRQQVIATLGDLQSLDKSAQIVGLMTSLASITVRSSAKVMNVLSRLNGDAGPFMQAVGVDFGPTVGVVQ